MGDGKTTGNPQPNVEIDSKRGCVRISVNPKIYPLDVVMSSGYIFTEKNYVFLDGDPNEELIVELIPKEKSELSKLGMEFNNELVNYATYAVQEIKNHDLRKSILDRVLMTNCPASMPYEEGSSQHENFNDFPDSRLEPWNSSSPEDGFGSGRDAFTGDKEGEAGDEGWAFDDPEGIAVPWEEKYGKKDPEPDEKHEKAENSQKSKKPSK